MSKHIETETLEANTSLKFVRLVVDGEEQAIIPWSEAVAIAEHVNKENDNDE